jgi:hemolysin III
MTEVPATARRYSRKEEIANSLTHGVGAGLAVAALVLLVTFSAFTGDPWRVVSFSIYGACLVTLYLASTFYHALPSPRLKRIFRILDHTAIFLLIAGTYTPITLVSLRGGWGWTLFGLTWGFALFGIGLEVFFLDRYRWLTLCSYLGMGWMAVIAIKPLVTTLPFGALLWLVAGGLCYTGGVTFYLWKRLPFSHAVWHLFVLGGSICHFFCFLLYVLPLAEA